MRLSSILVLVAVAGVQAADDPWRIAQQNARHSQQAIQFGRRYVNGWLAHADPVTGLLPRRVDNSAHRFWNAHDCAADNYPFLTLYALMTGDYHLERIARHIFEQEQKLTIRVDSLPDEFAFDTQAFKTDRPHMPSLIFGAAEYAKDGLIPITEWIGPSPWSQRMTGLIRDIWKHAAVDSPLGKVPTTNVEVDGDLLQTMSRLYWLTGDEQYKEWTFKIADLYLFHKKLLSFDTIKLRDHGCEIIGGLAEAYVIAAYKDSERREKYRPELRAVLDFILRHGVNEDGMMYVSINTRTGEPVDKQISDGWGYVYDAFLTVAAVDDEPRYHDAVAHALCNCVKYEHLNTPGLDRSVDELADSVEGALNLLNRLPVERTFEWIDREMAVLFSKQRPDGIMEGWYGDGNSTRTALMYALYKTQGLTLVPWRTDLEVGASRDADGVVRVFIKSGYPWAGRLRFDRARHREYLNMPIDYARINQFPEWFTVAGDAKYEIRFDGESARIVSGRELWAFPLTLEANKPALITIRSLDDAAASRPAAELRTRRYTGRDKDDAVAWQADVRARLAAAMKVTDLLEPHWPLAPKLLSNERKEGYWLREVEFNSTPTRRIKAVVTVPTALPPGEKCPAVVCIHGHGGDRMSVYDATGPYKGFADVLAASGYMTISTDVGQHEVYEAGRTLMGERLCDLVRCVDFLVSLPEVDPQRIGCAGLSLGGEMAMWLGALDTRIFGTVSCGFLTCMDQMEKNHCMCWKFDGLRELVDFADIYSLIAPRPLQCQNGQAEPPTQFTVALAREAMMDIKRIYTHYGVPGYAGLVVHPGGHEVDLDALTAFFRVHLLNAVSR